MVIQHLTFNDLRWFTTLRQGRPVRAYNYLYHEYTCNFMGNQNALEKMINFSDAPDNLVLGNNGKLSWGWN